jgi:hypothetical protein
MYHQRNNVDIYRRRQTLDRAEEGREEDAGVKRGEVYGDWRGREESVDNLEFSMVGPRHRFDRFRASRLEKIKKDGRRHCRSRG